MKTVPYTADHAEALVERGRKAWPQLAADGSFRSRLEALAKQHRGVFEPFAAEDFYLVAAFAAGVPGALALLRTALARAISSQAWGLGPADQDEVESDLMVEFFTATAPAVPGVLAFQGRGPLAAFFSVAVARRVVAHRQRNRRDAVDDEVLLSAVADADVGEVKVLKQRYGAEISRCFERAIATLSPPRRLLLRQHYLDGLSLEAIATMKDVHRATAARWLADARAELLDQVRGEVSRLLGIARLEVDSLVRAIDSRLDLSARLFLSRADEKAVDS